MPAVKGAKALGAAFLVLAAAIALPGISIAQDGSAGSPATPLPEPAAAPTGDERRASSEHRMGDVDEPEADQQTQPSQLNSPAAQQATTLPPSAPSSPAKASASARVSAGDNFYSPPTVSIAVGDTVTWTNSGQVGHTVTFRDGSFDTGVFGPGASRSRTFRSAGSFAYYCTVHGPSQSGTVRVASAGGGSGSGGGGGANGGTGAQSEADAVASPGAAGSSEFLPATGLAVVGLGAIGFALLGGGLAVRRLDREQRRSGLRCRSSRRRAVPHAGVQVPSPRERSRPPRPRSARP